MLNSLKNDIKKQQNVNAVYEATMTSIDDDDIKDAFLDGMDIELVGAAEDPEIAKLVESLPDTENEEIDLEEDLEEIAENFIPETISK